MYLLPITPHVGFVSAQEKRRNPWFSGRNSYFWWNEIPRIIIKKKIYKYEINMKNDKNARATW